ncbi:TadE/TadG family type IV pilus assembly protein [Streptomyces sp. SPB074]|uniref:TadE/TadG family type IV pilus assembly protein n=1 Tax=Streptomyces sp. (strain SPB074) TaxID=465543 RepID=UPI00099839F2|nr:TadE family protein [Streptomyces sp. SPB074]
MPAPAAPALTGAGHPRTRTGHRTAGPRTPALLRTRPRSRPRLRSRDDRGSSILEFAGFLPVLLLVGLAAIQLGLVGFAANQAGSGARAGARVASRAEGGNGVAAARAAMTDGLDATVTPGGGGDTTTYTVAVRVPTLLPFVGKGWTVTRSATMPNDDTGEVTLP